MKLKPGVIALLWLSPLALAVPPASTAATAPVAQASHAVAEIEAARVHAKAATAVDTLVGVHLHLHHVINCLVGPHGDEFDAVAEARSEHACRDLGNGALNDSADNLALQRTLARALHAAEEGVRVGNLQVARASAAGCLRALDRALAMAQPRR